MASSTNCQLGLTFSLSIKSSTIGSATNQTVYLSIHNDRSTNNTVAFTGAPDMSGGLNPSSPESGVYLLPSPDCTLNIAGYFAIYNSSSTPQQLNTDAPNNACCISGPSASYQFSALQTVAQTVSLGGYYHSSNPSEPWIDATYVAFAPGQYTVTAVDGWSQMLTLSFTVS